MRLKYKWFEFPSNPYKIEISSSVNCSSKSLPGRNSVVENISVNPTVVCGNGEFYGENCEEYCARLKIMLADTESGWLFLPSSPPVKAFFTLFKFSKSAKKNAVSYSFEFIEDCTDRRSYNNPDFIIADGMENAYEIANRFDVSVNDIMILNDFKSPFSIVKGDKVVLR
ncbi:MAG: LysM domain-containing protein [Eubacterium sp.]|nr:LysM domain-containing protein [Eubacterium sp.]MDE6768024.1 LysM domain-containing protein [Eubacterium sp.]